MTADARGRAGAHEEQVLDAIEEIEVNEALMACMLIDDPTPFDDADVDFVAKESVQLGIMKDFGFPVSHGTHLEPFLVQGACKNLDRVLPTPEQLERSPHPLRLLGMRLNPGAYLPVR